MEVMVMLLYEDKKEEVGVYEFIPKNNYDLFKYKTDELRKWMQETDMAVVVSEETGIISMFHKGSFQRNLEPGALSKYLTDNVR